MSSRSLVIAGIVAGILAGVTLFGLALAVVAIDGAALGPQMMAMLMLGAALGFVLDATWLTVAVGWLGKLDHGGDGEEGRGGGGWNDPGPGPARPWPPCEDLEGSPECHAELSAYPEAPEQARVPS
jgi:hypothetical protein